MNAFIAAVIPLLKLYTFRLRRMFACKLLPSRAYEFIFLDCWCVAGSIDEVAPLIFDTPNISRWWPQAAQVSVSDTGDMDGRNRIGNSRLKGFLPYELDVAFRVVEVRYPHSFRLELYGDLQGVGGGELREVGAMTKLDWHLSVRVRRPILRVLAFLARPLLHMQHNWVMRQGEQCLYRQVLQLRGACPAVAR